MRVLFLALLLGACASVPPAVEVVCPPLVEYGAEFQRDAARQLRSLPEGSPVVRLVEDYGALRDQIRACAR